MGACGGSMGPYRAPVCFYGDAMGQGLDGGRGLF